MARTELTAASASRAGLAWSGTPANAEGHMFRDNGRRLLRIKNTDSLSHQATFITSATVDGLDVTDRTVTIPASTGDITVGPFNSAYYQVSDGMVHVDYDAVTGLSVQLIEVPVG